MKNNLSLQLSGLDNRKITDMDTLSVIEMTNTISAYTKNLLPVRTSFGPVVSVKKIHDREAELNPVSNIPMKLVAARLSEIEMALDCYNVTELQLSTLGLMDFFQDKKMPAIYKLAAQMEKLSGENRFQEVRDLLRETKKLIGWIVKHRN